MKINLRTQLFGIFLFIFLILTFIILFVLPKTLLPVYEENLYNYLHQPHEYKDTEDLNIDDIAIVFISDGKYFASENYDEIIMSPVSAILENIDTMNGKIEVDNETYYFVRSIGPYGYRITITNSNYIEEMNVKFLKATLPILLTTLLLTLLIVFFWSKHVVKKISELNNKINNLNNDEFDHEIKMKGQDELYDLALSIERVRVRLNDENKYRNDLFQNVSHDLKTPITVIKSYVEAMRDNVAEKDKGLDVIERQAEKLKKKVSSLLYLNKLEYFEDFNVFDKKVKIKSIVEEISDDLKLQTPAIKWELDMDNSYLRGTKELWEVIVLNIVENAIRYANRKIKITLKKGRLFIYNDGPSIDDEVLENIFLPYKKGVDGNFGLGLSVVKKTLDVLNYKIEIDNNDKGVSFIIS